MAIEPVTREERFLAAAGGQSVTPPTPITRKEQLLQGIIDAVQSGGATPDVIENAVNKYLDEHPVEIPVMSGYSGAVFVDGAWAAYNPLVQTIADRARAAKLSAYLQHYASRAEVISTPGALAHESSLGAPGIATWVENVAGTNADVPSENGVTAVKARFMGGVWNFPGVGQIWKPTDDIITVAQQGDEAINTVTGEKFAIPSGVGYQTFVDNSHVLCGYAIAYNQIRGMTVPVSYGADGSGPQWKVFSGERKTWTLTIDGELGDYLYSRLPAPANTAVLHPSNQVAKIGSTYYRADVIPTDGFVLCSSTDLINWTYVAHISFPKEFPSNNLYEACLGVKNKQLYAAVRQNGATGVLYLCKLSGDFRSVNSIVALPDCSSKPYFLTLDDSNLLLATAPVDRYSCLVYNILDTYNIVKILPVFEISGTACNYPHLTRVGIDPGLLAIVGTNGPQGELNGVSALPCMIYWKTLIKQVISPTDIMLHDAEKAVTWGNIYEMPTFEDSGENVNQMEPAEDDIPKVFFGGALQQTKDEAVVPFRYISKTQDIPGYAEIKAQGNSSMNYPKKNQTVKMFKDAECTEKLKVDFKGWGKQNKHVYKANWIDLTHARNVVSARLWADVVKSRSDYVELPELFRTTPNQGAVDGFPVKVYAAGVYQGRYTLNIPKDKWTFNMNDELDEHCVLCGENYVSGCFRAAANINGSDWTDEIHDTVPESIKTRWNEVIAFVMNSTDEDFRANLNQYFYVDSLIDYYLFGLASCGLDAFGKNQIYATYDGQQWIASMYDMDSTWGLYWDGSKFVATDYARTSYEDYVHTDGNLLYNRLEQLFYSELQARWEELKNGALSIENIINRFERFTDIAPVELVKEDYAPTTGNGGFTGIPSKDTNNIQQIRAYALARLAWTDEYVVGLTPVVPVPCTGVTLDKAVLTFDAAGTQTLTATVTPEDTTDTVLWSSDNTGVARVNNTGVVAAIANGSATITATCGAYSATCSVTVEGIGAVQPVYSLAETTTFDGVSDYVDTGIKLYDTEKDWTILLAADFTQSMAVQASVLHCVLEEFPWPGVSIYLDNVTDDPATKKYIVGGHAAIASNAYLSNVPATATKLAIRCTGGKIDKVAYLDAGEVTAATPTGVTYTAYDGNLLLGCYQDTSGKKARFWQGSISQCDVYFAALSDELISAFLV